MILLPLFDCNAWTGASEKHPTGGIDSPLALLGEISQTRGGTADNDVATWAARRNPGRLLPFAVADPNWDEVRGELQRCFDALGMQIIKIHPAPHKTMPGNLSYEPALEFAHEHECLVVSYARMGDEVREGFTRAAKEHPDMTLMLYQAGRSWDRVDDFVAVAEERPNVLLEITFSYNVDGIIKHLIDEVGPKRGFFGTDIGARAPESQVGWATYTRIDEDERRLHMHENGRRLLAEQGVLPESYDDSR